MSVEEALEKEAAIEKEVMKRWKALGAIISVGRFRNELLIGMFKAGAMVGGGSFLLGMLFIYTGISDVSFPWVVAISLVAFIGYALLYAQRGVESALEREIRRRLREWG
jgi:hypothetical protein